MDGFSKFFFLHFYLAKLLPELDIAKADLAKITLIHAEIKQCLDLEDNDNNNNTISSMTNIDNDWIQVDIIPGTMASKLGGYSLKDSDVEPKWLTLPDKEPFVLCGQLGFLTVHGISMTSFLGKLVPGLEPVFVYTIYLQMKEGWVMS